MLNAVLNPWFWFQPLFYSLHGWIATEMAIWMLFHPYEPKYIPFTRWVIPFTPGIFPRGRKKLSVSIANTITDLLLTEQDIRKQAERLVTEPHIYQVIDSLSGSIYRELKDVAHLKRIYRYLDRIIPTLADRVVNAVARSLADDGDTSVVLALLNRVLTDVVTRLHITPSQADKLARLLLNDLFPPEMIRQGLVRLLAEENAYRIQVAVRKRLQGWQGVLLRFVDIQDMVLKTRDFMRDQPTEANAMLTELITELKCHDKLADALIHLPLHRLDVAHLPLTDIVKQGLIDHKDVIAQALAGLGTNVTQSVTAQILRLDLPWAQWLPAIKQDVARFTYQYLRRELAQLIGKALPYISLNSVIVEKIDQFSAQELEETIQRICRNELRTMAYLGAFLGFWLGMISNLVSSHRP
jgi:uncharacterized membrane protein YheB (UPF0754 family)